MTSIALCSHCDYACFVFRSSHARAMHLTIILQDRETPLILAAVTGHKDVAVVLLDRGADINLKNKASEETIVVAFLCGFTAPPRHVAARIDACHAGGQDSVQDSQGSRQE